VCARERGREGERGVKRERERERERGRERERVCVSKRVCVCKYRMHLHPLYQPRRTPIRHPTKKKRSPGYHFPGALMGSKRVAHKITLILDLDETLVHSSFKPVPGADWVVSSFSTPPPPLPPFLPPTPSQRVLFFLIFLSLARAKRWCEPLSQ